MEDEGRIRRKSGEIGLRIMRAEPGHQIGRGLQHLRLRRAGHCGPKAMAPFRAPASWQTGANWGKLGQFWGKMVGSFKISGSFTSKRQALQTIQRFFPMKKYAISDIHFNVY
jgi:hypothetical protein